jgi:hypothetical protein
MPGMVEAHTHFLERPAQPDAIQRMPPEEHILWCAEVAKRYLDMGWTSCVGAAAAKPRLDVVIRNAINDGTIRGPRYLAASQEITVPGGLGDTTAPHLPQPEFAFGAIVSGAEEMRRCVRLFAKYGVDTLKINLSGIVTGMPGDEPVHGRGAVCVEEANWRAVAALDLVGEGMRAQGIGPSTTRACDEEVLDLLSTSGALHCSARVAHQCRHHASVGPDARGDQEDGLPPRAGGGHPEHAGHAPARHPHPARG